MLRSTPTGWSIDGLAADPAPVNPWMTLGAQIVGAGVDIGKAWVAQELTGQKPVATTVNGSIQYQFQTPAQQAATQLALQQQAQQVAQSGKTFDTKTMMLIGGGLLAAILILKKN